jgi:hypothetical protein
MASSSPMPDSEAVLISDHLAARKLSEGQQANTLAAASTSEMSMTALPSHASQKPAGSKAARWAARASAKHASPETIILPGTDQEASAANTACAIHQARPCEMSRQDSIMHSHYDDKWYTRPLLGSAMEAWMIRAAEKKLHLPWADKFRDYCDETMLQKRGVPVDQILARRFHLNPAEVKRKVRIFLV